MKKIIGISLLTMIIVLVSFSTTTPTKAITNPDFLTVNVLHLQIPQGAEETLEVSLTNMNYAPAVYIMFVFSPGDLDLLKNLGHDFKQWLTNFHDSPFQFWAQIEGWKSTFNTLSLDIGYVSGILGVHDTMDSWVYPNDFHRIVGNLGTDEQGEYDVIAVGVHASGCFCLRFDCFHTSFFVVPEVPLGTIAPVVSSLGSLGFLGILTKRRKQEK